MPVRDKTAKNFVSSCARCQSNSFVRTIHLLRWMDQGADEYKLESHLLAEFGKEREKDGFIKSEITHIRFIRSHYGSRDLPAWIDWVQSNGTKVYRLAEGWQIVPKRI